MTEPTSDATVVVEHHGLGAGDHAVVQAALHAASAALERHPDDEVGTTASYLCKLALGLLMGEVRIKVTDPPTGDRRRAGSLFDRAASADRNRSTD